MKSCGEVSELLDAMCERAVNGEASVSEMVFLVTGVRRNDLEPEDVDGDYWPREWDDYDEGGDEEW